MRATAVTQIVCLFLLLISILTAPAEAKRYAPPRPLRVAVVGLQAASHINQLQGLAQELVRRKHEVFVVVNDERRGLVDYTLRMGAKLISAGPMPHPEEYYGYTQTLPGFLSCINDVSISAFDAAKEELKSVGPDVVIFDAHFPAGAALAQLVEAMPVPVSTGTVYLLDLGSNAFTKPMVVSGLGPDEVVSSPLALLQNTVMTWAAKLVVQTVRYFFLRPFWLHVGMPQYWSVYPKGRVTPLLAASVPGFEYTRQDGPLVQYTGPLLPRAESELPTDVKTFLDGANAGAVFISIGTNAQWTLEWADTFFEGIKRLPEGVRVLWATKKWQQDKYMPFAASLPDNIMLVDYVPQLQVLNHSSIRTFVTHCGYSSVQESVWFGVPMVGMAGMLESDQPTICSTLRDYGLGLRLVRGLDEFTPDSVAATVSRVLLDSQGAFKKEVERWRKRFHFQGGAAAAADLVEIWAGEGYSHLTLPEDESALAAVWSIIATFVLPLAVLLACIAVVRRRCCRLRVPKTKRE
eukprot:Hpha_TRINITY_DN19153_c0_g1::TRINITY_DN19153_c0_g1_i1::g.94817::m.94817/K00699/UGT; glucuronosyltransferase